MFLHLFFIYAKRREQGGVILRIMKNRNCYPKAAVLYCLICLMLIAAFSSCNFGNENKGEWKDPELVEVKDTDRSIQYYLPFNLEALAKGEPLTTDDLQASGRLLLTSGGNVKAWGFGDEYKRVYSFRCEPIGSGWYEITCWLKTSIGGEEYTMKCYTREKI